MEIIRGNKLPEILEKLNLGHLQFPENLGQLLTWRGFDNIESLALIEEEDLKKLEVFARNNLTDLLSENEILDFFGIYAKKPSLFEIGEGNLKLIGLVKNACKLLTEKNAKATASQITGIKRKRNFGEKVKCREDNNELQSQGDIRNDDLSEEKKIQIIEHVRGVAEGYIKRFLDGILVPDNQKSVSLSNLKNLKIEVKSQSVELKCPECNYTSKMLTTYEKGKLKWPVLSNFNKHYKVHFKTKNNNSNKAAGSSKSMKTPSILPFLKSHPQNNILPEDSSEASTSQGTSRSMITILSDSESNEELNTRSNIFHPASQTHPGNNVLFQSDSLSFEHLQDHQEDHIISSVEEIENNSGNNSPSDLHLGLNDNTKDIIEDNILLHSKSDQVSIDEDFVQGRVAKEKEVASVEVINRGINSDSVTRNTPENTPSRSRHERRITHRTLTFDENQTKLTDFYDLCKNIEQQLLGGSNLNKNLNRDLNAQFKTIVNIILDVETPPSNETNMKFFDMLKEAAKRNSKLKSKAGNRFSDECKKLCLYFYITAGRLSYQTLCSNMSNALPSITTLYRTFGLASVRSSEGEIRFDNLKNHFDQRELPKRIFISEDQTAILQRVRYDPTTNQIVGFVGPLSKITGFPLPNQNIVRSIDDIKNAFSNGTISSTAYAFLAQPLVDHSPAICICMFGSDNKFTAEHVLKRWNFLETEANANGISVEGFSSDGDPRCLKAMRIKAGFPCPASESSSPYSPYFQAKYYVEKPVVIQDTIHISTKIKTRLLNVKISLPMGKYNISKNHLEQVIQDFTKDQHFLCPSYLEGTDKMNFEAIDKLAAPCVISILSKLPEAKATRQILLITRYILDSFLEKSINIERRLYFIWYSNFFFRLWRMWIIQHDTHTLSKNWITLNTYTCVELNAHSILIMLEKCRSRNEPEMFLPWLFSSQPCEKYFRQARSMTSTYSTIVNFDMLDFLQRHNRIQYIHDLTSTTGDSFIFPREKNKRLGFNTQLSLQELPSTEEVKNILEKAKMDAINDARELGIQFNAETEKKALEEISLLKKFEELEEEVEPRVEPNVADIEVSIAEGQAFEDAEENDIEEEAEINKELNSLSDINVHTIKDYSKNFDTINVPSSFLRLKINNKVMTVRKSTLCWVYSDKNRLSADRQHRFKGNISKKKQNTKLDTKPCMKPRMKPNISKNKIRKNKGRRRRSVSSEVSSDSEETENESDYERPSETESDNDFTSDIVAEDENLEQKYVSIENEKYYAVYFDEMWFIGRVVQVFLNKTKIKFLKQELESFVWPRKEDVRDIKKEFIFYGPVQLMGNGPFQLARYTKLNIDKKYKELKRASNHE